MQMLLETERLILRPIRATDQSDLLEYHGDERVVRYIPWSVRSIDEVEHAISSYERSKASLENEGDVIVLGWQLRSTGKVIGQSNASLISLINQTADIGWVTHREFWRHGYAYEATAAFMAHILRQPTVHRIVANIDVRNPESAHLAEKLGMRLEGEFKQSTYTKGEWCDMWLYALLADDCDR